MFVLREYQEQAKKDLKRFLATGGKKGILVGPVSCGKSIYTALFSEMVSKPILVLQPSKELLEQNLAKANAMGIYPSVYSASLGQKNISNIIYATPQSVVKNPDKFKHIEYVMVDEAHLHFSQRLVNNRVIHRSKIIEFLDEIKPKKVVGITATPVQLTGGKRGEGSTLKMMNRSRSSYWYGAEIFHVTQIPEISEKYWSDYLINKVDVGKNLLVLNSNGTDFTEESLERHFNENNMKELVVSMYKRCVKEGRRSILTFVPTVAIATEIKRMCKDTTDVVTAKTPKKDREVIIQAFKQGNIRHVVSVSTLTTGFDMPELDTVIMARDTNSFALYYQMFGRLVRPLLKDGKLIRNKDLLIDFTGNTDRFGDIKKITFEDNYFVNGWGMYCGDNLITGVPVSSMIKPTKQELIRDYTKEKHITKEKQIESEKYYSKVTFNFGKYKGSTVKEVYKKNESYINWMLDNFTFSRSTSEIKKAIVYYYKKKLMNGG